MIERVVTNVHKEHGVIAALYGRGWEPRSKSTVVEDLGSEPEAFKYFVNERPARGEDSGNPIRRVHGGHGEYLRTDPDTKRTNLGDLKEPGRLEGDLEDEQGRPVTGAEIMLLEPNGEAREYSWLKTRTDSHGHFDIGGVPEGDWKLKVTIESVGS